MIASANYVIVSLAASQPSCDFLDCGFFHTTSVHLPVVPMQYQGAPKVFHRSELVHHDIMLTEPMSAKGEQQSCAVSLHDQLAHLQH